MKRILFILILLFVTFFVEAQRNNPTVSLFPVPLKINVLKVRLMSTTVSKASSVELRNFIGKKLQSVNTNGESEVEFNDMRQYPEGVYVVLVKDAQGKIVESAKFLISK